MCRAHVGAFVLASVLWWVVAPGRAAAQSRDEIEAEIQAALEAAKAEIPEPTLDVYATPIDDANIRPQSGEILIDGTPRATFEGKALQTYFEPKKIWSTKLAPGSHTIVVRFTYQGTASYGRKYTFTVGKKVKFQAQRGLGVEVKPRLVIDPKEQNWKKRFSLEMEAAPRLLAKIDTTIPPPVERPPLKLPEEQGKENGEATGESAPEASAAPSPTAEGADGTAAPAEAASAGA
ncbi:MAG: hypothetical protein D6729_07915, partial [Deltaproteobacteria bacterium]